ncbi:transcriptional regulator CynR [Mycolicibacterium sp. 120266]|uniref:transcriptional regulator CynR n=1 Tax=Mycolicibacterium sp. 120266 TaxID=3090601 RepID=UPI00299EE1AB|nr:transcriptional regulator CynR [Mycolicibacterium sp. 120266]MDX1875178.1 transcriptional regulator CynR [Mycolicibacterium sp. 120266]
MAAVELRHLRYLLAVAEHGSFSRAAEVLYVSQPTLSQQIKQLEHVVGAQLLDRSSRAVRLTDVGVAYVDHVQRALREITAAERAVNDVQDLSRGHLRLGVTPTFIAYLVGPLAAGLQLRHPGIRLTVSERSQNDIEACLLADDLDVGIAFAGSHAPGIAADVLFSETLGLVASRSHADELPDPLPVRALDSEHLALLSADFATRKYVDAFFAEHRVEPRITLEANSIQALIEIVHRTSLATVLPDAVAHDHHHLAPVPLDPPIPARSVVLLQREGAYQSAAAAAFRRLAHDLVESRGYRPPPA